MLHAILEIRAQSEARSNESSAARGPVVAFSPTMALLRRDGHHHCCWFLYFFFIFACVTNWPHASYRSHGRAWPRSYSDRREIARAAYVVTSTHAAHYLRLAPHELISDINTRIRVSFRINEDALFVRLRDRWSFRSTFNTHNERNNCSNSLWNDRIDGIRTRKRYLDAIFQIIL